MKCAVWGHSITASFGTVTAGLAAARAKWELGYRTVWNLQRGVQSTQD